MPLRYVYMIGLGLLLFAALSGWSYATEDTTVTTITLREPIFDPTVIVMEIPRLVAWPDPPVVVPIDDSGTGLLADVGEKPVVICDSSVPPEYLEYC